jgi:UDP-N-acetylglucosamine 4-epimerase
MTPANQNKLANMNKAMKNLKILITGGAGFIGSNLVEAFVAQEAQVVCLDNFSTGKRKNIEPFLPQRNFELIEGDIRNIDDCRAAVKGCDYILHQAALGSVPRSINDPKTTNDVNIGGFLNMIMAARDARVKRFIYAASSSTYGDHKALPKIEDRIGKPLSPYAVTKYVNELYAKVFSDLYGMETIGLRYFNVFGKRQDPEGAYAAVIPKFIRTLIRGESPRIDGDGSQTRDFTYVENIVRINQIALHITNKEALNTVYNVAYGEKTSVNELFEILRDNLKKYVPHVTQIQPSYGPERIGDVRHSLASIEKARQLLGFDPPFSIREGLKLAIDWYWHELK